MRTEYKSLHTHVAKSLTVYKKDLLLKFKSGDEQNFNGRQTCHIGFISAI